MSQGEDRRYDGAEEKSDGIGKTKFIGVETGTDETTPADSTLTPEIGKSNAISSRSRKR